MTRQPAIVLSSLDVARIEALIQNMSALPQLEKLEDELARGRIVAPKKVPADVVTMNSRVRFRMVETGREFEKTLCYPADLGKVEDGVSIFAPMGSALLGLRVGQTIAWSLTGDGKAREVEVVGILYQPESAGDYSR